MEPKALPLKNRVFKIGVIVGAGTGMHLADIFKSFLRGLVETYSDLSVEFVEDLKTADSPYIYHSYKSLSDFAQGNVEVFDKTSRSEAQRLLDCTEEWFHKGVRTIFRTSINAEALYLFRQKVKAVKVFGLETPGGSRLLFVRDQAEGFYANINYEIGKSRDVITFTGQYTRQQQQAVARYAVQAAEKFMDGRPYEKWSVYKHHLFADMIETWVREVEPSYLSYQPENALTQLYKLVGQNQEGGQNTKNLLIVCSNEVGDMIYEAILGVINLEAKLELYSRNIYCTLPFTGTLTEYQTVHGSADDIADTDKVIPFATLRIAADIAEACLGIIGAKIALENAISETKRKKHHTTSAIIDEIFFNLKIAEQI
jgi:tartrate dehydrogenase/decarboxylase / D-malate dehydrogenase